MKKVVDKTTASAQELLGIEEISGSILYTKRRLLVGFLKVRGVDNHLLSEREIVAQGSALASALTAAGGNEPWQILSVPRAVDTEGMIQRLNEKKDAAESPTKQLLLSGEIESLQKMVDAGAKEPMVLIKCWKPAAPGADQELMQRLREFSTKLESDCAATVSILSDREIRHLCRIYADLVGYHSIYDEPVEDIPLLSGRDRGELTRSEEERKEQCMETLIPVGGLDFGVNRVVVGPAIGRIFGATRYPSELDYGWAVQLVNTVDSIVAVTYDPGNAEVMGNALSRSISQNSNSANAAKDARKRMRLEKQVEDAGELLSNMDFKSSSVGHVSIMVMPFTDDERKLADVCHAVVSRWARKKIKLKPLGNIQKEAFLALSPYYAGTGSAVDGILRQIMPLDTLTGGFPLTVNIYRDDGGAYFARTGDGGIMALDFLRRDADRSNGNMVVTGESGQGKSTAVKHVVQLLYMLGVKVLILDPEREYKELCRNMGGCWLDVGGGKTKINPLQVRPVPQDEEEDSALYCSEENALALHIYTLEVFFSLLFPSLNDLQKAALKRALVECYERKKITWNTDVAALKAEDFPIMQDLYDVVKENKATSDVYASLEALIYDIAYGAGSFLFNGYSNVSWDADFIVFDTAGLTSNADTLKRAQYFNALSLCWQIMSGNRSEPVLLVADEAHLMMDPAIKQTAMYIRNIAKRCRKYEAMIFTIFQSTADMLYPEIRMYGQAILDNATYKLIFGCDGQNLEDTASIFRLTEQEQQILLQKRKRKALAIIGREHVQVEFDLPDYKLQLMGKGGGR